MRVDLAYGREHVEVEVPERNLVPVRRQALAPALQDPVEAVRQALEHPVDFPALRHALTPDDHVVIVVDDQLPGLGKLLMPVLEHLKQAHIAPAAITILCPPSSMAQPWLDDLTDEFEETRVEVHNPDDRRHLSYLASTRKGRRVYLNRSVVDADQVVVLTGRGYDPVLGYSGGETALFPVLSNAATRQELSRAMTMNPPGAGPWPIRREAAEVVWLLGAPILVQVIEGSDAEILHVLAGPVESSGEGQQLLDARWRVEVDGPADVVLAAIAGDPDRQCLADLGRAFACAARVVKPNGRIVLVTSAHPELGPDVEILRHADHAGALLQRLKKQEIPESETLFFWANAAQQAELYLLSGLPEDAAEDMFIVPLENSGQVQRLIPDQGRCLVIPDAHRTMAVVGKAK